MTNAANLGNDTVEHVLALRKLVERLEIEVVVLNSAIGFILLLLAFYQCRCFQRLVRSKKSYAQFMADNHLLM